MKQRISRFFLLLACGVLANVLILLAMSRPESHRPTPASQPPASAVSQASIGEPTLAPPRELVYIQVQADKSGLEVGWADK